MDEKLIWGWRARILADKIARRKLKNAEPVAVVVPEPEPVKAIEPVAEVKKKSTPKKKK